jgi:hypothetical protein
MAKKKQKPGAADAQIYKALRAEGIKKGKAERIAKAVGAKLASTRKTAPAAESRPAAEDKAATQPAIAPTPTDTSTDNGYADWTKADLLAHARQVNLRGRATMSKGELLEALHAREHAGA